jgi:dTDP-4-dehydrorhamnose reductase
MKIFLTGGSGQVGYELRRSLSLFGKVIAPNRSELNLQDLDAVNRFLNDTVPDLIVNAAAWTAVDKAEEEHEAAFILNAALPGVLANYAARNNIWLIHYSSDYVYPGIGKEPWKETDITAPLSVYGRSKLKGDNNIASSGCNYLIYRTSWVYSARGNNFMKTMMKVAAAQELMNIVNDQWGAPTPARLIADVTAQALGRISQSVLPNPGVYHLAPRGETNWHEFAASIFTLARNAGVKLELEELKGITTTQYPTPARRPLNSRLVLEKIENELGITMPDWYGQLNLTLDEYLSLNSK